MTILACVPYVFRQITRNPVRSSLTVAGIAISMFLFMAVQSMSRGVALATRQSANDTTLIVYREDRYCPATSQLPQDYQRRISEIEGVTSVIPMKIVVSNCRTSLDVVTFRGVPRAEFLERSGLGFEVVAGSIDDWLSRTDAALVGETLANRRGLRPGMRFDAAGITAWVAGIIRSPDAQDQNTAYTSLEFVQLAGRDQRGVVTQFNVKVAEASMLERVARRIDDTFSTAQEPTSTYSERAFIGHVASDLIELVGFARWLGVGCLAAVLALVGNSIVLSVQSRVSEHAVLQTLGFNGRLVAGLIVMEGLLLSLAGGVLGSVAAWAGASVSNFALSVEGASIAVVADAPLFVMGMMACGAIGALAGLAPAWQVSRRAIVDSLRTA